MDDFKISIIEKIVHLLWNNYTAKVTQVSVIEEAVRMKGDLWNEDHIAFRTLPGKNCGMHILQSIFEQLGYKVVDHYKFKDKKLKAISLNPPLASSFETMSVLPPKIFISELELEHFSTEFQKTVLKYTERVVQTPIDFFVELSIEISKNKEKKELYIESIYKFLSHGPLWERPNFNDYELLRKESEYAAWTLVFGNNVNHFTLSVHLMENFKSLASFNQFIENDLGIPMNKSGGNTIKGSPEVKLEQSATLAEEVLVCFQDCFKKLPYAFVEFAFRYPLVNHENSKLWKNYYQGFVTDNADKIFESTNTR